MYVNDKKMIRNGVHVRMYFQFNSEHLLRYLIMRSASVCMRNPLRRVIEHHFWGRCSVFRAGAYVVFSFIRSFIVNEILFRWLIELYQRKINLFIHWNDLIEFVRSILSVHTCSIKSCIRDGSIFIT